MNKGLQMIHKNHFHKGISPNLIKRMCELANKYFGKDKYDWSLDINFCSDRTKCYMLYSYNQDDTICKIHTQGYKGKRYITVEKIYRKEKEKISTLYTELIDSKIKNIAECSSLIYGERDYD